jgi:hypothetical protein
MQSFHKLWNKIHTPLRNRFESRNSYLIGLQKCAVWKVITHKPDYSITALEDLNVHLHCHKNLKSYKYCIYNKNDEQQ